jgi:hypothetical protein
MAGVAVPLGAHRRAFEDGAFIGAGTAIRISRSFDLVGSFAFQSSTAKYAVSDAHTHVLVYNVGVEKLHRPAGAHADGAWVPFAGAGVGGRANDFRSSALQSTACYAAYGNGGVEYERSRSTLRLEVRENLFCYKEPFAPFAQTGRNEISLGVGAGVRF